MLSSEEITSNPIFLSNNTSRTWHALTTPSIFIIYLFFTLYIQYKNVLLLFIGILISLILVLAFQETIINSYLKMFPYWSFSLIVGIISAIIWIGLMLGTMAFLTIKVGIFVDGLKSIIGKNPSLIMNIIAMPFTLALVFSLFTYSLWHNVIVPIHMSKLLSERNKLIFEAIIAIVIASFASFSLYITLIILLFSNAPVAFVISSFFFSYLTFTVFKQIFFENAFFKAFELRLKEPTI